MFAEDPALDLSLTRIVAVPRRLIWNAWTQPVHLMKWFTPAPWQTVQCEIDLRPGGRFRTVMRGPNGEEHDGTGCYLEIVADEKLIWTDALGPGYRPKEGGFMTGILSLEAIDAGTTRYTALVRHKSEADRKTHEEMGFFNGWNTALDQLIAQADSFHD